MFFAVLFILGMVTALNVNGAEASEEQAEASTENYYYYNGHTGYNGDGAFIADQLFINGLADNNFTLNGYSVNADPDANTDHSETLSVYDQTLYVNTDGEVYRADFPVNGTLDNLYSTIANIEAVYGEPEKSTLWYGDGEYYYYVGDAQITFTFEGGMVSYVQIGAMEVPEYNIK